MTREEVLQKLAEIEVRSKLPAFEKNFTEKDYAIKELERLAIKLVEELDKYRFTIEFYQPYFQGVDIIKAIDKNNLENYEKNIKERW